MDHTQLHTQRITISMPSYVYKRLKTDISKGEISQFVTQSVQNRLVEMEIEKESNTLDDLFELSQKIPKKTWPELKAAIVKGRL